MVCSCGAWMSRSAVTTKRTAHRRLDRSSIRRASCIRSTPLGIPVVAARRPMMCCARWISYLPRKSVLKPRAITNPRKKTPASSGVSARTTAHVARIWSAAPRRRNNSSPIHECAPVVKYPLPAAAVSAMPVPSLLPSQTYTRAGSVRSGRSVFPQSSTQGLVQRHEVLQARDPHGLQLLLGAVERDLRDERGQVAVDAAPIAHIGQPIGDGRGLHQSFLSRELLIERAAGDQRIGDLAKGGLNRLLVLRDRGVAGELGRLEVGDVGAAREDREADIR